jgi:hypothetical protein
MDEVGEGVELRRLVVVLATIEIEKDTHDDPRIATTDADRDSPDPT